MKNILLTALAFAMLTATAQTKIDKKIPVNKGQTVKLNFDYPSPVKVSTWDGNEIVITGTVSINGGENDDAFKIEVNNSSGMISVKNHIENMDKIPQRYTIKEGDSKITFRTKGDWKKYQDEHGRSNNVSMGIDLEIRLDIKIPKNVETFVDCTYGLVEVREFNGPLTVQATYGGVDASLNEKNVGELIAETNYGNIYSNLDLKPDRNNVREEDFHTYVSAHPGTGPRYRFESPYGNVYLRRGGN